MRNGIFLAAIIIAFSSIQTAHAQTNDQTQVVPGEQALPRIPGRGISADSRLLPVQGEGEVNKCQL